MICLNDEKIKKSLKIKDVIKVIEDGFRKKILGLVDLPPKMGPKLGIKGAFADAMPVSVFRDQRSGGRGSKQKNQLEIFGVKWISGFTDNVKKGIPYLNPLVVLNNPKDGLPIAILKGSWITAIRTAGVSAVTAKYLAPRKSLLQQAPTIGIFGLGLQAYVHVLVFKEIFKNPKFILFDHDSKLLSKFKKRFPKERFASSKNFHDVVKASDIILSATPFPKKITPYIYAKDLKKDVLILPLEYGGRIDPALYKHLDEVYTDDIVQYNLKSKLRQYFPPNSPKIKTEIGDLITKKYKRESKSKRILVFNLGLALFDILVARACLKRLRNF